MSAAALTHGNAAKLYCLNRIDELAELHGGSLTILDLGCGEGRNFVALLKKRTGISYIGVDPSSGACDRARQALAGLAADIVHAPAYDVDLGPADVVVSFSVLEHVFQRHRYMACMRRNLATDGLIFLNYDAGHFVNSMRERWRRPVRELLARLGRESKYQQFVTEAAFHRLIEEVGLRIVEDKFFNTRLKSIHPTVPAENRSAFMQRWLDLEIFLNTLGIEYKDAYAPHFMTRNFVLALDSRSRGIHP
jgi:cyclopropane fatty-acyl-phospholipid synthase-like methyltransferase